MVKCVALILLSFLVMTCAVVPEREGASSPVQERPGFDETDGAPDASAASGPESSARRSAESDPGHFDPREPTETDDRADPEHSGMFGRPESPGGFETGAASEGDESGSAAVTGSDNRDPGSAGTGPDSASSVGGLDLESDSAGEDVSIEGSAGGGTAVGGPDDSSVDDPDESAVSLERGPEPDDTAQAQHEAGEPVLPPEELPAYAVTLMPSGVVPVMRAGRPASLVIDLDSNGEPDLCVLAAAVESGAQADMRVLSDYSRIFKSPPERAAFTLELFRQTEGKLTHTGTVPLGTRYVLESFARVPLSKHSRFPEAAAVEFLTSEGGETEWVIFPGDGSFDRLTIHDKPSLRSHIGDIDRDGIVDVVLEERLLEAGTGHETFLTWFRWESGRYREKATTNIVRNLRVYLRRARELLVMRGVEEFLRFALAPDPIGAFSGSGGQDAMLRKVFRPAVVPGAGADPDPDRFPEDARILDILFPEIVENPFPLEGEDGYRFTMPLRIRFEGGEDMVAFAAVELSENPFAAPQYRFVPR
jgi:hypothetical protein